MGRNGSAKKGKSGKGKTPASPSLTRATALAQAAHVAAGGSPAPEETFIHDGLLSLDLAGADDDDSSTLFAASTSAASQSSSSSSTDGSSDSTADRRRTAKDRHGKSGSPPRKHGKSKKSASPRVSSDERHTLRVLGDHRPSIKDTAFVFDHREALAGRGTGAQRRLGLVKGDREAVELYAELTDEGRLTMRRATLDRLEAIWGGGRTSWHHATRSEDLVALATDADVSLAELRGLYLFTARAECDLRRLTSWLSLFETMSEQGDTTLTPTLMRSLEDRLATRTGALPLARARLHKAVKQSNVLVRNEAVARQGATAATVAAAAAATAASGNGKGAGSGGPRG